MEKERQYKFDKIEVCRNCGGTGTVERLMLANPSGSVLLKMFKEKSEFTKTETCPVCDGSGRVEKHTEINITIKPYETEEKQ